MRDGWAPREPRTLQQMQLCLQIQNVCEAGSPLTPDCGSNSVRHLQLPNFLTLRTPPEVPQHQQPLPLFETNKRVREFLKTSETLAPRSPTPFRPMPPRKFLLGNNVKRIYPDMPLGTLPPDVLKSTSAWVLCEKAEAHADVSRSANFAGVIPENTNATSTTGGSSIVFTRWSRLPLGDQALPLDDQAPLGNQAWVPCNDFRGGRQYVVVLALNFLLTTILWMLLQEMEKFFQRLNHMLLMSGFPC